MAEEVHSVFPFRVSSSTTSHPQYEYSKFSVWFLCLSVQSRSPCVPDAPGHARTEQASGIFQVSNRYCVLLNTTLSMGVAAQSKHCM